MKKKFFIFTLCFTLIFSNLNYKKTYAFDGGLISAPMVGVLATTAIASGVIINNSDDIVNLANSFYHTYKDRQEEIKQVFNSCVSIASNGVVSVGNDFLNYVKDFLDFTNSSKYGSVIGYYEGIPVYDYVGYNYARNVNSLKFSLPLDGTPFKYGNFEFKYFNNYTWAYHNGELICQIYETKQTDFNICIVKEQSGSYRFYNVNDNGSIGSLTQYFLHFNPSYSSVFTGSFDNYNWDSVSDRIVDDSLDIYVPSNVDSLVGVPSNSVVVGDSFNPPYELPNNGVVGVPDVSNPSIDIDNSISFPTVGSPSVPNEGIWATIKDFIVGLVVPSDTYWTDTWGGLYNNFTSSFPMVDMDGFNDLVTGEKKFPNIDINIMGVNGRVVNGDVINSIVDWLRPIIAGFMMLCLMLFNYRKIYKLIRNTEPFGSVASGTSDFKTGISEYNKEPVIKAVDMASEYRAWKENGGK